VKLRVKPCLCSATWRTRTSALSEMVETQSRLIVLLIVVKLERSEYLFLQKSVASFASVCDYASVEQKCGVAWGSSGSYPPYSSSSRHRILNCSFEFQRPLPLANSFLSVSSH